MVWPPDLPAVCWLRGDRPANSARGVGVGVARRQRQKLMQYQHVCAEPQKRTLELSCVMSALCQKRTWQLLRLYVDLLLNNNRECERKCGALARLRLDPNPSAVHLNDALRYGQPQAGAALLTGDGIVGLLKL